MPTTLPWLNLHADDFSKQLKNALKTYSFCLIKPIPAITEAFLSQFYNRYQDFFQSDDKYAFRYDHDVHDGFAPLELSEKAKNYHTKDFKEFFHYFPWGRCPDPLAQLSIDLFTSHTNFVLFSTFLNKETDPIIFFIFNLYYSIL